MAQHRIVQGTWAADKVALWESLFTIANGHFGLRGSDEERRHAAFPGTLVNGFFEKKPINYGEWAYGYAKNHETILNVANVAAIELEVDGQPLDFASGKLLSYQRIFDLDAGVLTRSLQWIAPSGASVRVESSRLASFERRDLAIMQYKVAAASACRIRVSSLLDGSVRNRASEEGDPRVGTHLERNPIIRERAEAGPARIGLAKVDAIQDGGSAPRTDRGAGCGLLFSSGRTRHSGLGIAIAACHRISGSVVANDSSPLSSFPVEGEALSQTWELDLAAGECFTLEKYIAIADGAAAGMAALEAEAQGQARAAAAAGYNVIAQEQASHLSRFWANAAIEVDGDASAEEGLAFNMFHLYQSAGCDGKTDLAAKGLTGEGYEGHYFWDTEIFALPFFTYEEPKLARSLIDYRISKLDKARGRAAELSLPGALFPWRTIDGEEASAYYPAGTAQYHIDADIAYALSLYASSCGDVTIWYEGGAELLFETARLWMGLGFFNPRRGGAFCIPCVTGPDEYTALVDNNAYTNLMAEFNLRKAAEVAEQLAAGSPSEYRAIAERIGLAETEIVSWRAAADHMYIPIDGEMGIIAQDDQFLDRPEWNLAATPKENFPLLLHYHPLIIYRHRVLKQPDTVLALFLRHERFSLAEKMRNFNFYEPLTTGDSSLSHGIQSVMAAECGYIDKAFDYFQKTARMDLDDIHANTRDGVHIAAMAESWIAVVYGFAGMRETAQGLSFSPALPAAWSRLAFSVTYRHSRLSCEFRPESSTYRLLEGPSIEFAHENTIVHLQPEGNRIITIDERPQPRAWVFDLDGVIADTAVLHYKAWKKLADELGIPFDLSMRERLKGVSRRSALLLVLGDKAKGLPEAEIEVLSDRKNACYRELLKDISPSDILPGMAELLESLRADGAKLALASVSRNAGEVIAKLGLKDDFDVIVDPAEVKCGKPDPEIFLRASELLGARRKDCIVLEDAEVGIQAAKAAGMFAVGIGAGLDGAGLDRAFACRADICFPDTASVAKKAIEKAFQARTA
ncbi:MAG: beta-phosphoglucomutase [Spirochaetaceae bacterium]|nr:beta-phosphoglucomutase [Spirochaetaceae bacterium]